MSIDTELGHTVFLPPDVIATLAGRDHADHVELTFTEGRQQFVVEADADARTHEWADGTTLSVLERMGQQRVLLGRYALGASRCFQPIDTSPALQGSCKSGQFFKLPTGGKVEMPSLRVPHAADFWVRPADPRRDHAVTIHATAKPPGQASTVVVSEKFGDSAAVSEANFMASTASRPAEVSRVQYMPPPVVPSDVPPDSPAVTSTPPQPEPRPAQPSPAQTTAPQSAPVARILQAREVAFSDGWQVIGDTGVSIRRVQDPGLDALLVRIEDGARRYDLAATSFGAGRLNDAKSLALIDTTSGRNVPVPGVDELPNRRLFTLAGGGQLAVKLATASLPDQPVWIRYDHPGRDTHIAIESTDEHAASLVVQGDSPTLSMRLVMEPDAGRERQQAPQPSDQPVDWPARAQDWARSFMHAWKDGYSVLREGTGRAWQDYGPAVNAFIENARAGLAPAPAFMPASLDARGIDRRMDHLNPAFRAKVQRVYDSMRTRHGYEMVMIEGRRTQARQDSLFDQGPSVTRTQNSAHVQGRGADSAFVRNGRVVMDADDAQGKAWLAEGYRLFGKAAKEEGLVWGGDWKSLRDYGHVEMAKPLGRR